MKRKEKNIRKLKVYGKFTNHSNNKSFVPEIRLSGKWLKELGFKQGQSIIIICEEDKITIQKIND
jgi:toxic protein SymE